MVNEPEKLPLTTVDLCEYSPFCWMPDLCRRVSFRQLSDMRVPFPGNVDSCATVSGPTNGRRDCAAELSWFCFFLS